MHVCMVFDALHCIVCTLIALSVVTKRRLRVHLLCGYGSAHGGFLGCCPAIIVIKFMQDFSFVARPLPNPINKGSKKEKSNQQGCMPSCGRRLHRSRICVH